MNSKLFQFLISYRFAIPNKYQNKSRFLSWFSIIGLSMGISILIVVMSVMNGFENEIKDRVLSITPHVKLKNKTAKDNYQDSLQDLKNLKYVTRVEPYIEKMTILSKNSQYHVTNLVSLNFNSNQNINYLKDYIIKGDMYEIKKNTYSVIMGDESARKLGVSVGDKIRITLPNYRLTPMGYITREKTFEIVSIFKVGTNLDLNTTFVNLPTSQKLFQLVDNIDGFHINFDQYMNPRILKNFKEQISLLPSIHSDYKIKYWRDENSTLFNAIFMEKTMIFILLISIITVAAFNIISVLLMNVIEKKSEISLLRTLGCSSRNIIEIFILQGLLIGLIGITFGVGIGVLVSNFLNDILFFFENIFNQRLFDPSLYYISYLPSKINYFDCIITAIFSLIICILSTLYPAIIASKIQPSISLAENN